MDQEIIQFCNQRGILLDKYLIKQLTHFNNNYLLKNLLDRITLQYKQKIITKSFFNDKKKIIEILSNYNNNERIILEDFFESLGIDTNFFNNKSPSDYSFITNNESGEVSINKVYHNKPRKLSVEDFINNFKNRFLFLKNILQERPDLDNLVSINKLETSTNKNFSLIGIVYDKHTTKNGNVLLTIEDLTGSINALVNKNKSDVFEKSKEILFDEVIALKCSGSKEMVFVNDIIFPDSRIITKKKSNFEEYAAFTSDIHVGSDKFLESNFIKFINWLNGNIGDENQRREALKVKYLFITGDSIDGVGIYPGQESQLIIKDVNEQYKKLAELLLAIRPDVSIILCAGQHDAVRVAEPQPIIGEHYGSSLNLINNLYLVSNPSIVSIGRDVKFKVLMYHGASIHGIINEIDSLRINKAHDSPTSVVKYMLKKRHLAPTHSLVTYTPLEKEDALLVSEIPDILATGDLHRPEISDYNGVILIASSCWQSKTPFEEKVGNNPDPCKVPLFNLKTREIKILDFSDNLVEEKKMENAD
ncbi:MAG: hypothetical protein QXI33_00450 [Candidatus Pacearchaeota archaeon]